MTSSRDNTLMGVAELWAEHSTCSRLSVGAVISRDGRSLSSGYNGAPKGMPHCVHNNTVVINGVVLGESGCTTAVHAELNAIAFAARYGMSTDGADLHCTHQPCLNCAMAIINAGIIRVVYLHPYRDPAGTNLLLAAGVTALKAVR